MSRELLQEALNICESKSIPPFIALAWKDWLRDVRAYLATPASAEPCTPEEADALAKSCGMLLYENRKDGSDRFVFYKHDLMRLIDRAREGGGR